MSIRRLVIGVIAALVIGMPGGWLLKSYMTPKSRPLPQGGIPISSQYLEKFYKALDEVEAAEGVIAEKDPYLKQVVLISLSNKGEPQDSFGKKWRFDRECRCLMPIPQPLKNVTQEKIQETVGNGSQK